MMTQLTIYLPKLRGCSYFLEHPRFLIILNSSIQYIRISCKKVIDKKIKTLYNKYRKWRNHKRGLPNWYVKKHTELGKLQMCFFIVYLLKIITSIIKANTIIVSTTKPNKSRYIISNKTASIIAPPPFSQLTSWIKSGKPHLLILISYG